MPLHFKQNIHYVTRKFRLYEWEINEDTGAYTKYFVGWGGDRLPVGFIRKPYTRTHAYPTNTNRIKPFTHEKAAIIMLRRHGYPVNMLSKVLGRSTSYIHRVLRSAITRLTLRPCDMRKLPGKTRMLTSGFRWRNLQKWIKIWEAFILGEVDKPP